jgi:hypothetical protein
MTPTDCNTDRVGGLKNDDRHAAQGEVSLARGTKEVTTNIARLWK